MEVCAKQNRHVQSCAAGICVLCWPDLDASFYDELSKIGGCDPAFFGKILELDTVADFPNTRIDNQVSGRMEKLCARACFVQSSAVGSLEKLTEGRRISKLPILR